MLPGHPNGMVFTAVGPEGRMVRQRTYFSVGGGFVIDADELRADVAAPVRGVRPRRSDGRTDGDRRRTATQLRRGPWRSRSGGSRWCP
ncbi:serine dehydratase beta chain [Blastococcus goldschmidtiae]|uniref:serine dehydratase beta chain n=1 Tax=Blastococcus goldschmidtiae TaxID=3075546 RepID=UPI0037BF44A6